MIVFIILLISAFLRFYNLPNNFVFAGDEEHQAILAQTIVKHFHIIWIGVNAAHLGFYLGPYWVYFTSFWLYLSKGDPLITGYVSATIGIITTFLIIWVGSTLFNKKKGLLASLLYTTLPLMVFLDQKYWNPTPVPILSLLMLLSLSKVKKNPKWIILFSACFGMIFHIHLSLFPILFVAIFWFKRQKIKLPKKIIFLSVAVFLVMITPLIAFDYFHKGTNITTPLRLGEISSDYRNQINPKHHLLALFQTLGRVWYLKSFGNNSDEVITSCTSSSRIDSHPLTDKVSKRFTPPAWLSLAAIFILLLFLLNKQAWKKDTHALLALFILSITLFFLLFPGGAYEYYLLGIFPLLMFLPGILIGYFNKLKFPILFASLIVSILGVFTIMTNNPQFGLSAKNSLIKQTISVIDNHSFELKQTGICHFYEGWRYLFVLNGKTPQRTDSDKSLGWLYDKEITNNPTKYTVILSEKRAPINFDAKDAKVINSGGFTSYIFQNF